MNDANLKEQVKEKDGYGRVWQYLLIFAVLLFFCVFGITYTFNKEPGGSNQEIDTGNILFGYSDINQAGNGIYLNNAMATSDTVGKIMVGNGQYFDFYVTAKTGTATIKYKLLLKKGSDSTLANSKVRVYLTSITGNYEQELLIDDFSNLKEETINGINYYVLYEKKLGEGLENYVDSFRYRMWVKEDAVDYYDQSFSVKIDVYAYQVEE